MYVACSLYVARLFLRYLILFTDINPFTYLSILDTFTYLSILLLKLMGKVENKHSQNRSAVKVGC